MTEDDRILAVHMGKTKCKHINHIKWIFNHYTHDSPRRRNINYLYFNPEENESFATSSDERRDAERKYLGQPKLETFQLQYGNATQMTKHIMNQIAVDCPCYSVEHGLLHCNCVGTIYESKMKQKQKELK